MEEIKEFLPIELDSIKRASTECVDLAKTVKEKFTAVVSLVEKLLEVSLVAKKEYGKAGIKQRNF